MRSRHFSRIARYAFSGKRARPKHGQSFPLILSRGLKVARTSTLFDGQLHMIDLEQLDKEDEKNVRKVGSLADIKLPLTALHPNMLKTVDTIARDYTLPALHRALRPDCIYFMLDKTVVPASDDTMNIPHAGHLSVFTTDASCSVENYVSFRPDKKTRSLNYRFVQLCPGNVHQEEKTRCLIRLSIQESL